jgi:hypothetical protein
MLISGALDPPTPLEIEACYSPFTRDDAVVEARGFVVADATRHVVGEGDPRAVVAVRTVTARIKVESKTTSSHCFSLPPNSTPCGRTTHDRSNGRPGVGCRQGEFSILVTNMAGPRDTLHWGSMDPRTPRTAKLVHLCLRQVLSVSDTKD